jgi:phosphoglycolate phosphatase-like HAD superfamily hydrolase
MTYVFDIDGTLCTTTEGDYKAAEPLYDRISVVNKLYDEGHKIILCTARGMGRSQNSIAYAQAAFRSLTKDQLDKWGVKYHELFLGKPAGDIYVDDKGCCDTEFFDQAS